MSRTLRLLVLIVLLVQIVPPVYGQEIITLRSGNGAIGSTDNNITFFTRGDGAIGPFSAADFTAAMSGARATIVAADPVYVPSLTSDPAAQWIAIDANKSAASALYAYSFQVNSQSIKSASIDLNYSVDNSLGEPSVPGLYIDGSAIPGSTNPLTLGEYAEQFHFTADISSLLHPGMNTLYFYQYDVGIIAGSIFSATLTIQPAVTLTPDLLVKLDSDPDSSYLGSGIFSPTPIAAQSSSLTIRPGGTAAYDVKVVNTTGTANGYVLKAVEDGDPNWRVTYRVGSEDITGLITGGGYTTDPLSPGGSVVVTVDMVSVPGIAPGVGRTVVINAFKNAGDATAQDSVLMDTDLTPIQDSAPAAPTNLSAAPGSAQVKLSWTAPLIDGSHGPALSYNVKRSTARGGPYTTLQTGVTATMFTDSAVTNGTTYYYVVSALNAGGESPASNEVNATPNKTLFAPAAPSNLTAAPGDGRVSLAWTPPSADGSHGPVASYNVKRSTTSGGPYTTLQAGVPTNSFTDSTVTNGTTYYYVVSAVNAGGESSPSNEASVTPPGTPPAPSNLSVKSTSPTTASLTWTSNGGNLTGFQIERATGTGSFAVIGNATATATSFNDSGLSAATTYVYRIRAANANGLSDYSNTASVTTVGDSVTGSVVFSAAGGAVPASGMLARLTGIGTTATVASAVTDASGHYSITGLRDGSYTVTIDAPNQATVPTSSLTISGSVDGGVGTANFTLAPLTTFRRGLAMVSVPFDYSATDVDAAVMFGVTPINGVTPIAAYDTLAAQYLLYPKLPGASGKQTIPGQGYWIEEGASHPLIQTGARVSTPFDAALLPGWNLIGNPFLHPVPLTGITVRMGGAADPVSLQAAQASGLVGPSVWTWDDTQRKYTAATTLEPFVGYWVYIDPAVALDRVVTVEYADPSSVP